MLKYEIQQENKRLKEEKEELKEFIKEAIDHIDSGNWPVIHERAEELLK